VQLYSSRATALFHVPFRCRTCGHTAIGRASGTGIANSLLGGDLGRHARILAHENAILRCQQAGCPRCGVRSLRAILGGWRAVAARQAWLIVPVLTVLGLIFVIRSGSERLPFVLLVNVGLIVLAQAILAAQYFSAAKRAGRTVRFREEAAELGVVTQRTLPECSSCGRRCERNAFLCSGCRAPVRVEHLVPLKEWVDGADPGST
jgi:hypothetical protein